MAGRLIVFTLVRTESGREHDVARRIKELGDPVREVLVTYGEYDVIVRIEPRDMRELDRVITAIRGIPGLRSTTTLIGSPA